jgi:hypothetical protein
MEQIDVPVGKKFMLTVKPLDMDDAVEIIRVECVEDDDQNRCSACAFRYREECCIYHCYSVFRKDGKSVYFKKIEVVDEELNLNNKNMSRKFDLDAAVNRGAKIRTRCGYPARIICTDRNGLYPVVALLSGGAGEFAVYYTVEGRSNIEADSNYDLEMVPEKRYINIIQDKDGKYHCSKKSYPTEEMAKELEGFVLHKYKGSRYVATIEIED